MESGSYTFFKREEQNNRTGSQTEQERPGKHQQCHLSPVLLQPVNHCQRNRRNWLMNTGKPPGQKFPLQRAGSTVCWNRQQNETLKDLKTLKLDKTARRGVKAADDPRQQHSDVPYPSLPAFLSLPKQQENALGLQDIYRTIDWGVHACTQRGLEKWTG